MQISVCIPHYNRSKHLVAVLETIKNQEHPDVEVVISDDCSTDDSEVVIPQYLETVKGITNVRFVYIRQPKNLGYDANLRAALSAATGEYLFILGNDDGLASPEVLTHLDAILHQTNFPDVAVSNYHPSSDPQQVSRRAASTTVVGSGPAVALKKFRAFSFVGGIVLKRSSFKGQNTAAFDGSVYVQIYLASRIIAAGGTLVTISDSMVAKDLEIKKLKTNSYRDHLNKLNQTVHAETGGLDQVGLVAAEAILPCIDRRYHSRAAYDIYAQLLTFTYGYWLLTYRKDGVYKAAVNLALGCWPWKLIKHSSVGNKVRLALIPRYVVTTLFGLLLPLKLLSAVVHQLVRLARLKQAKTHGDTALAQLIAERVRN